MPRDGAPLPIRPDPHLVPTSLTQKRAAVLAQVADEAAGDHLPMVQRLPAPSALRSRSVDKPSVDAWTLYCRIVIRELDLAADYSLVEGDWVQARLVGLPGVLTVAPTRAEAQAGLLDALAEYLLAAGAAKPDAKDDALHVRLSA